MTITPQWKDELRARITLSSVIRRTTKLTKAGREWKACCPFHAENTPSFTVSDDKGFYHCFGCGAHGDVISWMIEQRGLSFMDAIRELAAEAGMEVPAPDPVAAKRAEQRASLIDVTSAAQDFFAGQLAGDAGRAARDYLKDRGFSDATLREFGFGYAPDDRQALARALAGFEEDMLVETGMRIRTDDGSVYDRFRGRVMLPIQDARGRVIAFGGRILDKREGVAKYLNSPDTPLFDKGRTLYNLHRAAPAARQTGRVIVVEGYMDVVALAQAGFADAVAPLGTALTETQLEMLWRLVERPVLCFDGDAAGQRAAYRAVERALPILQAPRSLSILRLPAGQDPDEIVRRHGPDYFTEFLKNATPLVRFIWETELNATPLDTPEQKAFLRQRLIEQAFKINDEELRKLYRRALVDLYYSHLYPDRTQSGTTFKHGLLSTENLARLKHFVAHGDRQALIRATLAAIAQRPELIGRYIEKLWKYNPKDEEVTFALDVFLDAGDCILDGADLPEKLDEIAAWHGPIPYPFARRDAPMDFVVRCLDEALVILVDKPATEAHFGQARARFSADPTQENEKVLLDCAARMNDIVERQRAMSRLAFS